MKKHAYIEWFYGHYQFETVGSYNHPRHGKSGRWVYDDKKIRNPHICMICSWTQNHPMHQ